MNKSQAIDILVNDLNVSRETLERLRIYESELIRWNSKINLVAHSTLDKIWERHFLDSIQIAPFIPKNTKTWLDLGSGGGFPALVLAAQKGSIHYTLVESDQRKCVFLRKCAREMGVDVEVINLRIEVMKDKDFDVISARALADLDQLIRYAQYFSHENTFLMFSKGKNWKNELTKAEKNWQLEEVDVYPSRTDPEARILTIKGAKPYG